MGDTMTQKEEQAQAQLNKRIKEAVENPEIPKYYANGFVNATSHADAVIVFDRNNSPVLVLNLSFTIAKTLALKLGQLIKNVEDRSGNIIFTTADWDKAMAKEQNAKEEGKK